MSKSLVAKYLAEIGAKGGKASRRTITPAQQVAMQEARKAAKLCKEQNVSDHPRNGAAGRSNETT